jgi:hypothetical protein
MATYKPHFGVVNRSDPQLGECQVVSVRFNRGAWVALDTASLLGALYLVNISLGPSAHPLEPAGVRLAHVTLLTIPLAVLFSLDLLRRIGRLVFMPTELWVSGKGFRIGYLTHSRTYNWSGVALLTQGRSRFAAITRSGSNPVAVLASLPGRAGKRVAIPCGGPWPPQTTIMKLLTDGQMGRTPQL